MVTVPAFVWRGGALRRALTIGAPVGLGLGVLAWLDSGFLLAGLFVFVVVGVFYGVWMTRRMARYWPGARDFDDADRVAVVDAVRRGERVEDPRLARGVIDYAAGMRASAEAARSFRWLFIFVIVVAVGTAVWDTIFGSIGNAVASGVYLVMLLIELFWWPKRLELLLANAARASELAHAMVSD